MGVSKLTAQQNSLEFQYELKYSALNALQYDVNKPDFKTDFCFFGINKIILCLWSGTF